jgi:hypothetical protein
MLLNRLPAVMMTALSLQARLLPQCFYELSRKLRFADRGYGIGGYGGFR